MPTVFSIKNAICLIFATATLTCHLTSGRQSLRVCVWACTAKSSERFAVENGKNVNHIISGLILLNKLNRVERMYKETRKPCCRKETVRCRSCSFQFKVRRRHSLQV